MSARIRDCGEIGFGSAFGRWQEIWKSGENLQILKKCELSAAKYVTALLSEPHMGVKPERSLGSLNARNPDVSGFLTFRCPRTA